jgi:hypothetical protein
MDPPGASDAWAPGSKYQGGKRGQGWNSLAPIFSGKGGVPSMGMKVGEQEVGETDEDQEGNREKIFRGKVK